MKKFSSVVVVSMLIFGIFLYYDGGFENVSAYTSHATILIDGNSDFASQSVIEGWAGNGSQTNPYIIEGYDINASTAAGIEIKNTDVYFVIRDSYIHDGGTSYYGIILRNVINGEIKDSYLSNNDGGIANYAGGSNNKIFNNTIYSSDGYAIILYGSTNTVSDNNISYNKYGLYLRGSANTIFNNSIYSNNYDGIYIGGSSNTISNNSISNNNNGIKFDLSSEGNLISNNIIYSNNNDGIYLDGSSNTISNNSISNNNDGIYLDGVSNIISNNSIYSNKNDGIKTYPTSRYHIISNNSIYSNNYDGIYLDGLLSALFNNHVYSNNNDGINLSGSSNTIFNNSIHSNNICGINVDGSTNTILNNSIYSNNIYGINLVGSGNTISNNSIINHFYGISIYFSLNNIIFNNNIYENNNGIYSIFGDYNKITHNRIYSNNWSGIYFKYSDDNNVNNNGIYSNNWSGIYLISSDSNIFSDNNLSSNKNYGIYLSSSCNNEIYHNTINNNTAQANDDGLNSWNLLYPGGGNYWDDYTGYDVFLGTDQDIPGSDGFGDIPYNIPGGAGAKDMYPFVFLPETIFEGDIIITSHNDHDTVSGIILIETAVTSSKVGGVNFYINGTLMNLDTTPPYQYILNTTTFSEDTSFELKAEAMEPHGHFISTSITLWVNNIVDVGSYITVSTLQSQYSPDEDVSLLVTMVSPPYFDSLELDVNCMDPSWHPLYTSSHNFYPGTEYRVILSIPSDAELGTYTIAVYAYGFAGDSLIWSATNGTTFLVSGPSLREQLKAMNETLSGLILDQVMSALNQLDQTLSSLDLTELLDAIGYLNQTLPVKLDDLLSELSSVEDSISSEITDAKKTLLSQLSDLYAYVKGFNKSLTNDLGDILSTLQLHDENTAQNNANIKDKLDDLLTGGIWIETINDLKATLTNLAGDVSSYNQSIAEDIMEVVADIDDFEIHMYQKLNAINGTIDDLDKDIKTAEETLQTSIDDIDIPTDKIEEEGFGMAEGLLIVAIILLMIILLVMLMGRRETKKGVEAPEGSQEEDSKLKSKTMMKRNKGKGA